MNKGKMQFIKKGLSIFLSIATLMWSLGVPLGVLFAPSAARAAAAIVISPGTVNANFPGPVKASSAAIAVAKISVTASSADKGVGAITVNFSGTGFATTDLQAIATGTSSGVALYTDHASSGTASTYDDGIDPVVTLAASPAWTPSTTNITLTPATPVVLTNAVAKIFYIVIKTSGTAANGDQIVPTIPANGVVTTDGNGPTANVTITPVMVDAVAPTISGVNGFSGSATVTVNFSEPVQKVGGGALVAADTPLVYTDDVGEGNDQTISSISHNPGWPMATVTMSGNLDAEDVDASPATMRAGAGKIEDMAGNEMGTGAVNFGSPLSITTVVVPSATAGATYSSGSPLVQFASSGGTGSKTFTANSAGDTTTLTALALTLGTDGKLTTATTLANTPGSFQVNIKVTDGASATATKLFTINVQPTGGGAIPGIIGVTPAGAGTSSTANIVITGSNTAFTSASVVTVDVPPGSPDTNGITVGTITRNSATSITAPLTISDTATAGSRDVRVVTGTQVVNMPGGFGVFASGGAELGLLLPANAATSIPLPRPSFNFTPSANASVNSYRITVASTSDFATKVWDYTFPKPADAQNTNGSHCSATNCNVDYGAGTFLILTQPVSLAPNTTYYWKVSTYAEAPGSVSAAPVALETTPSRSFTTMTSVTDFTFPTINHRPVFQATASTALVLFARVMDNFATTTTTPALTAKLFHCQDTGTPCTPTTQVNGSSVGSGYFSFTIPSGAGGVHTAGTFTRYYLQAFDGTNTQNMYQTGTTPFQITSAAAGALAISGTVQDSAGACPEGVQSARVFAEGTGFSATTNGSCAFTLSNLFAGTYDLIAVKDGYSDRRIDGVFTGTTTVALRLSSGAAGGFGGDTTKPQVVFTAPPRDMMNVPGEDSNMKVMVGFSKSMSTNAVTTAGNLVVKEISTAGAFTDITTDKGSWTYYTTATTLAVGTGTMPVPANTAVWSFSGTNTFGTNKTIAVVVSPNVTDTAGNPIQGTESDGSYAFTFTTSGGNFTGTANLAAGETFGTGAFVPPHVVGSSPAPGSTNVPRNAKVTINFSDPMADDAGSYVLANFVKVFTVSGATETDVSASAINTVTLDTSKKNATINLKTTFNTASSVGTYAAGIRYRIKVLGGAKAGNNMTVSPPGQETTSFYILEFTPGTSTDDAAPSVVGSYPSSGDTNVPVNMGVVSVGFNKSMDSSTITSSNITLSVQSSSVNGTVTYDDLARQALFTPKAALSANTTYTISVGTGVTAANGVALASAVTRNFTTGSADSTDPEISFINADDFGLAITFSEPMNAAKATDTLNFATSVLKLANYTVKYGTAGFLVASGTAVTIPSTATITYDAMGNTVIIEGYSSVAATTLQGQEIYVAVTGVKDLSGNSIKTTNSANTGRSPVLNSATTKGALGPMAMSGDAFGGTAGGGTFVPTNFSSTTFGFAPPVEVRPFNMMAGQTTIYGVRLPVSTQIPASGTIVLTFPSGFDVSLAQQDINSPMRSDLNGPGTGTVKFKCNTTVAGVAGKVCSGAAADANDVDGNAVKGGAADDGVTVNQAARSVTVTLSDATNSAGHDFLNLDISGIKNSTVPKDFNTAGYTVDIKTKNGTTVLESLTSQAFFIQAAGTNTLSGNITATANDQAGTMKVYLMSPMTGPLEATSADFATTTTAAYSFSNLSNGEYWLFTDQAITLGTKEFVGKTMPERVQVSGTTTYNFTLANTDTGTAVTVTVNNAGDTAQLLDIFAGSPAGFKAKQVTANAGANTFTLNLADGTWWVGVGPQMPKGPMAGPPPAPSYVMPKPVEVRVTAGTPATYVETSGTANDGTIAFTLTTAGKQIRGLVKDGANKVMANAEVYAYDPQGGFGTHATTDTTGAFTMQVVAGSYTVGSFVPGMPPSKEVSVVVTTHATDYLLIAGATTAITPAAAATSFVLKVAKPDYTISGKVTDGTNVVQGASVFAYRTDGPGFANANTDSAGQYTLYVSNGTWNVGSFLPQYGNLSEQSVTIASASQSNINFQPTSTGTFYAVSGRVYQDIDVGGGFNGSDVAIQGAFVRITGNSTNNETITGSNGTYSFNVPSGNGYVLKAFAPGIGELPPLAAFNVTEATTDKDITVTVPRTITITLSSSVAEAFIDLFSSTGVGGHTSIRNTTTGTLSLPEGSYRVEVHIPGVAIGLGDVAGTGGTVYSNTTGVVTVDSAEALTVTIPTLRTVSGTVTDGTSNIADAWVEISNSATGAYTGTKSASNGAFTLSVPNSATNYRINAMKPGYFRDATALTVTAAVADGALTGQTITVATATLAISGTVYIGATGAANAFVRAEKQGGGFSGTQADANGVYSLPVNAGTWRVYAIAEGYAEATTASSTAVGTASVSGVDITLSTSVTLNAPKSKPITPSSGGTVEDATAGIKITFPASALGSSTSAGNVQAKETNNIRSTATAKPIGGTAQEIKATDSGGTPITTLSSDITIEQTVTLAKLNATASATDSSIDTLAEAGALVMAYWDESLQNWVPKSSTVTYKNSAGAVITDRTTIDTAAEFAATVATVTISTVTDHLSLYAPVSSTGEGTAATPSGFAAANGGLTQLNLSWTAVTSPVAATGYDIYRSSTPEGTYSRLGSEPTVSSGSTTTYSDTGLASGTTYFYKITSMNGSGESGASNYVSASTTSVSSGGSLPSSSGGSSSSYVAPAATPTTPAETPAATPTPAATELQLVAIPAVPANPTVAQIQAAITAILNNINYLRAQLAILIAEEQPGSKEVPSHCRGIVFSNTLKVGSSGNEMKCLQALLNQDSGTKVSSSGAGSPGNETTLFGSLTKAAVVKFQEKYALSILTPLGLTAGTGILGPATRAKLNALLGK